MSDLSNLQGKKKPAQPAPVATEEKKFERVKGGCMPKRAKLSDDGRPNKFVVPASEAEVADRSYSTSNERPVVDEFDGTAMCSPIDDLEKDFRL